MKRIYLLLTRSSTLFSRLISMLTGDPYTHISISAGSPDNFISVPSNGFYSFGRKNPYLPFPAGFVRESDVHGFLQCFPDTPCTLLSLEISDDAYHTICTRLQEMEANCQCYHYNLLGVMLCGLKIPLKKPHWYFCSQFVADLLTQSNAAALPKQSALMHPVDFTDISGTQVVYIGTTGGLFALASSVKPAGKV